LNLEHKKQCIIIEDGFNSCIYGLNNLNYDVNHVHLISCRYSSSHAPLISQIVQLQHRDWIVHFHHTLRQGNEGADWLAKHVASSSDALKSWIFCPPQLHRFLLDDALGVARLRL
jgi:hypothetical protein